MSLGSWNNCSHVESHKTEVRFSHWSTFRISDHKDFFKSNDVDVWMVFFPCGNLPCVKVLHFKSYWKISRRKRIIVCVCVFHGPSGLRQINKYIMFMKHPPVLKYVQHQFSCNLTNLSRTCNLVFLSWNSSTFP